MRCVRKILLDSRETAVMEFVNVHPELYNKEHGRVHDRQKKEALWAEICRTEAPALSCQKML